MKDSSSSEVAAANPAGDVGHCRPLSNRLSVRWRWAKRGFRRLLKDERGTTSLEWALLLGAIALPSVYLLTMTLGVVVDYYRMMTQISSLPLP